MSNLASSPDEINQIERALREPCDELIAWQAQRSGDSPKDIAADVKEIVSLKPVRNLGHVDPSVNKARRFEGEWKDRFWGLVWSHMFLVSQDFPKAIFLAEYWDDCMGYAGKSMIHAGHKVRCALDGDQHAHGWEWVMPNIFAPFLTEYEIGLECGSLWDEWMEKMENELSELKQRYSSTLTK